MIFREAIDAIIGRPRQRGGEREVRMHIARRWVEGEVPATEVRGGWEGDPHEGGASRPRPRSQSSATSSIGPSPTTSRRAWPHRLAGIFQVLHGQGGRSTGSP